MQTVLRSKQFNDVYFSAEDGLAETQHVFLQGNSLPEAWAGRDTFIIGETGFGTGLNFLAAWQLFEKTAEKGTKLHFISVEKYPLFADTIDNALVDWDILEDYRMRMVDAYPDNPQGVFEYDFGDVKLTIIFADVVDGLKSFDTTVDAWFLDGFRPASNPEMWTDQVFEQVGRLSKTGTNFATFTAAGFVRRGLDAVGFDVRKLPGFGRKREMSVGVLR